MKKRHERQRFQQTHERDGSGDQKVEPIQRVKAEKVSSKQKGS